jgi:serine/threonine-protein kinase RsbW
MTRVPVGAWFASNGRETTMSVAVGDVDVADFECRVPATAEQLSPLRHALADWATGHGLATHIVKDMVHATYEAMANVVLHAYRDRVGGTLDLYAHADQVRGIVTVSVADYGRWRPPPPNRSSRGRGLSLIHGLAEHTGIRRNQSGTTVTMTYRMA